jgi:hypothetical protein
MRASENEALPDLSAIIGSEIAAAVERMLQADTLVVQNEQQVPFPYILAEVILDQAFGTVSGTSGPRNRRLVRGPGSFEDRSGMDKNTFLIDLSASAETAYGRGDDFRGQSTPLRIFQTTWTRSWMRWTSSSTGIRTR